MEEQDNKLLERFLTYVAFDTQSKSSANIRQVQQGK